jgi:hypothetical protein
MLCLGSGIFVNIKKTLVISEKNSNKKKIRYELSKLLKGYHSKTGCYQDHSSHCGDKVLLMIEGWMDAWIDGWMHG